MDITPIMGNRMATEIEIKMDTRREAEQGMGPAPPEMERSCPCRCQWNTRHSCPARLPMMPVGARSCTSWPAAVHLSAKPACFAQGGDSFLVPEEVAKQSVLLGHLVLFFPSVLQCVLQPLILFLHVVDTGILWYDNGLLGFGSL